MAVRKVVGVEPAALKRKEPLGVESAELAELREMKARFRMHFLLLA